MVDVLAAYRFNFRATKYLWENGWTEFFHWYYTARREIHPMIYCLQDPLTESLQQYLSFESVCVITKLEACEPRESFTCTSSVESFICT